MNRLLLTVLILLVAYLGFWPVPIEPQPWTPPKAPATDSGVHAANQRLQAAQVLARGQGVGPEGVALAAAGGVYTAYVDGRVVRVDPDTERVEVLGNTGGRPLGLIETEAGLVVADARKGLLRLNESGTFDVLSSESDGRPFAFTDDVDVAPDGRLYFSDASHRWGMDRLMHDFFEHGGSGRLLRYDPATGETETLLDGLHFANGIAVGPDGDYVLVTETGRYQVTRYWIQGPKAGQSDRFATNLPGFPDNISYDGAGLFWLALYGPRDPMLDRLLPMPWLRKVIFRLPSALHPDPARHAHILALDLEGRVVVDAQASGPEAFAPITSVKRQGDTLYLGSLSYPGLARIPVEAVGLPPNQGEGSSSGTRPVTE